jgi:hypothetical protein
MLFAAAFASLLSAAAVAQTAPQPFASGDPHLGKPLVEKDCVACHVQRFGGDGSQMYTRAERRVTTPAQLLAQVRYCNTQLGTRYFPEEEEHVAAYLNKQYYHFR